MLIRHPTSGLFWSVNDDGEICLAKEGSVYVKSTCDVPPHICHFDDYTSHLKNTVTGKCICRIGDKLVEIDHAGVNNTLFEWTINDGVVRSYMDKYVESDLTLVYEPVSTQWLLGDSFDEMIAETVAEVFAPAPVEEVPAPVEVVEAPVVEEVEEAPVVEEVEDVPVSRASALIEEALNVQAAEAAAPAEVTEKEDEAPPAEEAAPQV